MTYFQSCGYETVKLFVTQVVMAIYGLIMAMATINNDTLSLLSSLLAVGLYAAMIYSTMWNMGGKDRIRFDAGRANKDFFKPLFMALVSNIPNFIFGILLVIAHFASPDGGLYTVSKAASAFLQGYFSGIITSLNIQNNPFTYLVAPFIIIFFVFIFYVMGWFNITIIKRTKKEEEKLKK